MSVRVLIVDDHAAMRQSLAQVLGSQSDVEVVGEASDGATAVRLADDLEPDVVVMDIVMPCLNGIDATRRLLRQHPKIIVIGLSVHDCAMYAARMLGAGARAYVLKDGGGDELIRALKAACNGRIYLSSGIEGMDRSN